MSFGDDFKDMCQDTATWEDLSSRDAYGAPTYAAGVTLNNVRLVRKHRLVRNQEGDEVVSSAHLWIVGQTPAIEPEDRVTLSDASAPEILAVERPQDESGSVTHVKVFFR